MRKGAIYADVEGSRFAALAVSEDHTRNTCLMAVTKKSTQSIKNLTAMTLLIPMLMRYLPTHEPPYLYNALPSPEPKLLRPG